MTVYVETDFLLALAKDTDWLQESADVAFDNTKSTVGVLGCRTLPCP